jgi:hypothetical protein
MTGLMDRKPYPVAALTLINVHLTFEQSGSEVRGRISACSETQGRERLFHQDGPGASSQTARFIELRRNGSCTLCNRLDGSRAR